MKTKRLSKSLQFETSACFCPLFQLRIGNATKARMLISTADVLPNRCVRWANSFIWLPNFTKEESLFIEHFWARNSQLLAYLFVFGFPFYGLEVSCHSGSCAGKGNEITSVCVSIMVTLFCREVSVLLLDLNKAINESSTLWVLFSLKLQSSPTKWSCSPFEKTLLRFQLILRPCFVAKSCGFITITRPFIH